MDMLIPVVLCGGVGARLWPVSRESYPKPFIKLQDGESLIQKTFKRASMQDEVSEILTVTNRNYYFQTRDEFTELSLKPSIPLEFLLEPFGRNTAPAIALAAMDVAQKFGGDAKLLVLPADHIIQNENAFSNAVQIAVDLAEAGQLVTFGLKPEHPDTGFGYIEKGHDFANIDCPASFSASMVKTFAEKPDLETAQTYVDSGNFLWNAGIFCFRADTFLEALDQCSPEVFNATKECFASLSSVDGPAQIHPELFSQVPDISVDYAVMEKAKNVAVVGCDIGWSDVGSWASLSEHVPKDQFNNSIEGEGLAFDSHNCYIHSEDRLVATLGVKDLVVIDTSDALLVADKNRAQDVKKVVQHLKNEDHPAYRNHSTVHRPWGTYTELEQGERFKIKRIVVKPDASLSLQMHYHRCEHWIVVSGTARIVNGDKEILLKTNESTFIPSGEKHRLENPGKVPLILIEVQSGEYLEEDDIVRFDDVYGRH
jgi:mannose-1-phosphate guanylyltransferase/mannose-6-phosphate isomerase